MCKIAISIGDINGIGSEVVVKALSEFVFSSNVSFIIVSPDSIIDKHLEKQGKTFCNNVEIISNIDFSKTLQIKQGEPTAISGEIAYKSLEKSINMAKNNEVDALVTAPISKAALKMAGYDYTGHTEILQEYFKDSNAQMLFVSESLRLLLLTRHIPLKDIARNINKELIIDNVLQLRKNLQYDCKLNSPQMAMCGLNPHSGESGTIGTEETEIIIPAMDELKAKGINISGPYAADSFWHMASEFDCIVSLYHDQGLIPVKLMCRDNLVNVTTGLPIVRTSPCHGTAYDIAGKNIARATSIIKSIELAIEIVKNRKTIN